MDPDDDPHEIAADLSRKPHRILIAINSRGGEARTRNITEDTDLDGSVVNYHYKDLRRADLIERVGDDQNGGGIPRQGYTYQITDRGREVLSAAQENFDLAPVEEGVVRQRLGDLEARVADLEQQLQTQNEGAGSSDSSTGGSADEAEAEPHPDAASQDRVAELEGRFETIENRMDSIQSDFSRLVDKVEEYLQR